MGRKRKYRKEMEGKSKIEKKENKLGGEYSFPIPNTPSVNRVVFFNFIY